MGKESELILQGVDREIFDKAMHEAEAAAHHETVTGKEVHIRIARSKVIATEVKKENSST